MRKSIIALTLGGLVACKSAGVNTPPPASHGSGTVSPTGAVTGGNTVPSTDSPAQRLEGAAVLDAQYAMTVTVAGIPVCTGTANLLVNVPSSTNASAAKPPFDVKCLALSCAFGKQINIDSLLGALGSGAAPGQAVGSGQNGLTIDDKYIRISGKTPSAFAPALVLLPNFTGTNPNFLAQMNESQHVRLTDPSASIDASGDQHMKTLAYNTTWTGHKVAGVNFNKVFQFQIGTDGFFGVDKLKYFLFNSLDARINLTPLALLSFEMTTKVSNILPLFNTLGGTPPSSGECGIPPPAPLADAGGLLARLLGVNTQGLQTASNGGLIGAVTGILTQLIDVRFAAVLIDQKGLREAISKQNEVDSLINSQTSGRGS